jgi:hypothetical protein
MHQGPFVIPQCEDSELLARLHRVQPLVRDEGGKLKAILLDEMFHDIANARNYSYLWNYMLPTDPGELVEVAQVQTLHTFGYLGLFKPSIAEVLCQMPSDLDADFFEVVGPNTSVDLNAERDAVNAGFHVATTIFYKKAMQPAKMTDKDKITLLSDTLQAAQDFLCSCDWGGGFNEEAAFEADLPDMIQRALDCVEK